MEDDATARRLLEEQAHQKPPCLVALVPDQDLGMHRVADALGGRTRAGHGGTEALLEAPADPPEVRDDGSMPVLLDRRARRGQGERVAAERARDEDVLELAHQLTRTDHGGEWKSIRHSLAECGEIRRHPEVLLGASDRPA